MAITAQQLALLQQQINGIGGGGLLSDPTIVGIIQRIQSVMSFIQSLLGEIGGAAGPSGPAGPTGPTGPTGGGGSFSVNSGVTVAGDPASIAAANISGFNFISITLTTSGVSFVTIADDDGGYIPGAELVLRRSGVFDWDISASGGILGKGSSSLSVPDTKSPMAWNFRYMGSNVWASVGMQTFVDVV